MKTELYRNKTQTVAQVKEFLLRYMLIGSRVTKMVIRYFTELKFVSQIHLISSHIAPLKIRS